MSADVRNVIIVGSGPAGYTAAIYAARANLQPLVFEGSVTAGGALMNTTEVENFPGFPDGIMGPALMDDLRKQAERFGAELIPDDITDVDLTGDIKVVGHGRRRLLRQTVILAMGSGTASSGSRRGSPVRARRELVRDVRRLLLPRPEHRVVGGGDSAVEEADVPDPVRVQGHAGPPAGQAPGQQIMARAPRPTTRSTSPGTAGSTRSSVTSTSKPSCSRTPRPVRHARSTRRAVHRHRARPTL